MTYTLYGARKSRAFRVLWLLEELGVAFDHVPCGPRSEEARAVNPAGKIPILMADGVTITDSTAILTYLADRHGAFTAPAGTIDRARQDAWTFRVLDEIEGPLWAASKHAYVLPEAERIDAVPAGARTEFARNMEALAADIGDGFLTGPEPTVPDIILGHCGGWAMIAGFPEAPEAFVAYLARLRARPAFARAARRP